MNAYLVIDARISTGSANLSNHLANSDNVSPFFCGSESLSDLFILTSPLVGDRDTAQIAHMKWGDKFCRVSVVESGVL